MTTPGKELLFLALGGSGEIGMNANLYGCDGKWIMADLGVTFGSQDYPGIDIVMPDLEFIEDRKRDLLGIVLTHGHEDHIGAIPYLAADLGVPLYATPFTAGLIRRKLEEEGLQNEVKLHVVPMGGTVELGPFKAQYVALAHSIPEGNALVIDTPHGRLFHTGDWKLDPHPVIGKPTDIAAIQKMGDEGLLAMVCDSTNVFVEGESGSEADVKEALAGLIGGLSGKVAVACFASNVARMDSVIRAAEAAGRGVCLVGRSMHRMAAAAKSVGLLDGVREFLSEQQAAAMPENEVLFLCTGSQGEPRAALSRIADGSHPHVKLGAGDACVFSSRVIPGNEIPIRNLQNRLADRGVRLYTERDHPGIHVSGHPCRDELAQMYAWARPQIAVPTHGERRHLLEHAAFAKDLQVPQSVAPRNGDMVRLAPGRAEIIDEVPAGRIYVDAGVLTPENGDALRERRHAAYNGVLAVSVVLDGRGKVAAGPQVRALGLPADDDYPMDEVLDDLAGEAQQAFGRLKGDQRDIDTEVETALSRAVKKASQRVWGRRPVVETTVLRV